MVATPSTMLTLGTKAPTFCLPDPRSGNDIELNYSCPSKGCLIAFICNHCPYVLHLINPLTLLCNHWNQLGVKVIFISSNDIENYPADSPLLMKELAEVNEFKFPYLYDQTQAVAQNYQAACTPDFFLFDSDYRLFYRGQFDDSRPNNALIPTGTDLRIAVERMLANLSAPEIQKPSLGCNLKWKKGNEPFYYNVKV